MEDNKCCFSQHKTHSQSRPATGRRAKNKTNVSKRCRVPDQHDSDDSLYGKKKLIRETKYFCISSKTYQLLIGLTKSGKCKPVALHFPDLESRKRAVARRHLLTLCLTQIPKFNESRFSLDAEHSS